MSEKRWYFAIRYFTALVWLMNGLYCKVLNFVPRHQMIVERILHTDYASLFTKFIGIAEVAMFIWILTGYKKRFNTIVQIVIIGCMNLLEFILAPDLLLWGRMNAVYALLFMLLIAFNEFRWNPEIIKNSK